VPWIRSDLVSRSMSAQRKPAASPCRMRREVWTQGRNDATAPLRVSFILKPAAPDIISRKIDRADRDAVPFSPCSENFDHLILISLDTGKCQSKLGQSRRSVAVDTRALSAVPVPRISWGGLDWAHLYAVTG
jgi:hypothetical protein